jgi:hypothetical protein
MAIIINNEKKEIKIIKDTNVINETDPIWTSEKNNYYTKIEVDSKLANKSNITHNHSLANLSEKSYNSLTDKPDLSSLHSHSNKELLDTYTQTETDLADAVNKKHSHANKTLLDNLISNGTGTNFLADDGTYKSININNVSNADTVDNYHASQTPAPDTIPVLNNNGILDLSSTYIKSNIYTFRRIDLTNATEDYMLQVGEEAIINFINTNGTSGTNTDGIYILPNNTTYSNNFISSFIYRSSSGLFSSYLTFSSFLVGIGYVSAILYITNYTQYKNIKIISNTYGVDYGYPCIFNISTDWRNTTTVWTSLGMLTFGSNTSGYIIVRRLI